MDDFEVVVEEVLEEVVFEVFADDVDVEVG